MLLELSLILLYYKLQPYTNYQKNLPVFWALSLAIVLITAGGYVINNLYDIETDRINEKKANVLVDQKISISAARTIYGLSTGLGLLLCAWQAALWLPVFVLVAGLLYWYSKSWKAGFFWGNVLVAALSALPIYVIGAQFQLQKKVYVLYGFFAFACSLLREIAKDAEDQNGDRALHMNTLAIKLGTLGSKKFVAIGLLLFALSLTSLSIYFELHFGWYAYILLLGFGLATYTIYLVQQPTDFAKVSLALKVLMLLGVLGIIFIQ